MKIDDRLEKLKQFDTPSITNVVATYPDKEYCLGLYHPWRGQWYTDERARVMYPELGRTLAMRLRVPMVFRIRTMSA